MKATQTVNYFLNYHKMNSPKNTIMTGFIKRVNSYKFTIRSSLFLGGMTPAVRTSIRIQSQGRLIYPKNRSANLEQ